MEMEKDERGSERSNPHILVFPFPSQGHINPILQFSKRLVSKGVSVTLLTTLTAAKSILNNQADQLADGEPNSSTSSMIKIEIITDGSEDRQPSDTDETVLDRFKQIVSKALSKFIENAMISTNPPKFLIYDSFMPWAMNVAQSYGLERAPFFTQSCALSNINFHIYKGLLNIPIDEETTPTPISLPSMPLLEINDLPKYDFHKDSFQAIVDIVTSQHSNFLEADLMFCNTFDHLEDKVIEWMRSCKWPIKAVGPTIPSFYLDQRVKDDRDYGVSLFKPNVAACLEWLDTKETGSVIYASFGSIVVVGENEMEEVASGIMDSNYQFLWVIRESEQTTLPSSILDKSEKGLVVTWCPQLEVLSHRAIGCFMTHCGWNSTLEALCLGVPMVAIPQWADQITNAKFIADVWKVGVRVKANENGFVTKEEIACCIRQVMEGERRDEIKANSIKWKQLGREAVDEGGSSDKNINEFVAKVKSI